MKASVFANMMPPMPPRKPRRGSQIIIALVCCFAVVGYKLVRDDNDAAPSLLSPLRGRSDASSQLLQQGVNVNWELDDAFVEAQWASARANGARSLKRKTAPLETGADSVALASDAEDSVGSAVAFPASESSGTTTDITCRDLGITNEVLVKSRIVGNTERWRQVIQRVAEMDVSGGGSDGQDSPSAKVAVLGGSVPAGSECEGVKSESFSGCEWPAQLQTMMRDLIHPNVQVDNLAHPATASSTGITQVMDLVDYDVIIIQWTTNDDAVEKYYEGDADRMKPVFETLVRTALDLPKNPAIILFEDLGMQGPEPVAELVHYAIATIYEIPVISARAAFWRQEGFDRTKVWSNNPNPLHMMHPKAIWHKRLACLVYDNWVQESKSNLDMSTWRDPLDQKPVFGGATLRCTKHYGAAEIDKTLNKAPSSSTGWKYMTDAGIYKYGYISETKGSLLQFDIPHGKDMVNPTLFIHYLRSYTPEWGKVYVNVRNGIDEHMTIDSKCEGGSQTDMVRIPLKTSKKPYYSVRIKNGAGKFKITGVMLYDCAEDM